MGKAIPEGAFSLSDDGFVYAHRTFVRSMIGTDELKQGVDRFLSAVGNWSELTEGYGQIMDAAAKEKPNTESVSQNDMTRSGFMQV